MSKHPFKHYRLIFILLALVAHYVYLHLTPVHAVSRYPASSVLDWQFNRMSQMHYGLVYDRSHVLSFQQTSLPQEHTSQERRQE